MMWRVKQLADPDGVLNPGVVLNRDPDVHLRNLKSDAADRGGGRRTAWSAASASPCARAATLTTTPRQRIVLRREMARQPDGLPGARGAARRVRVRRASRPAPRTAPACSPARWPSTPASCQGVPRRAAHATREERAALTLAAPLRGGRARGARRACARAARRRSRGGARARRGRAAAPAREPRARARAGRASMPPPAPARLPDTARAGRRRRVPAGLRQPDLRQRPRRRRPSSRCPRRWWRCRAARACRCGSRPTSAGHCCATPWSSKGYRLGQEHMARHTAEALWRWTDGGALPVVIDASSCAHGLLEDVGPVLDEDARASASPRIEVLDSIAWAHDHLLPRLDVRRAGGLGGRAPHVLGRPPGARRTSSRARWPRALADEVVVPLGATAAGWRATAGCSTPSCPRRRCATRRRSSRARDFDAPRVLATAPARSGSSR